MSEYILREAATKSTWMILEGMGYPRSENRSLERTVEAVFKSAPAADVAPVRHGRWIVSATNLHFDSKCSACGETFYSPLRGAYIVHHAKYCPSCGAKMDGGQDDV